jgi:hypothetical protein
MTWILVVAGVWTLCAVTCALLLGLAIGHADRVRRRAFHVPDHVADDVVTATRRPRRDR